MIIIDQNRAHQRILYEEFLSSITTKKNSSQQLLYPLKIKLNTIQALELENVKEIIDSIGFKFELKKITSLKYMDLHNNVQNLK